MHPEDIAQLRQYRDEALNRYLVAERARVIARALNRVTPGLIAERERALHLSAGYSQLVSEAQRVP